MFCRGRLGRLVKTVARGVWRVALALSTSGRRAGLEPHPLLQPPPPSPTPPPPRRRIPDMPRPPQRRPALGSRLLRGPQAAPVNAPAFPGRDAVGEQGQQEDLEEKFVEGVCGLPHRQALRLAPGGHLLPVCWSAASHCHALEKCLRKGRERREQALAAAILGLGEELSHSLQPPLVSVLRDSTAGPAAWLHCASALGVGCYDGAAAGVQDLVSCLTCLEGVFSRLLCAALQAWAVRLTIRPSMHMSHVLSRRLLRLPRLLSSQSVNLWIAASETIALPLELAGGLEVFIYPKVLYDLGIYTAFKDVPGSGLHHHLQNDELLRDIFGLGPVLVLDATALKACKIPPFKKHRYNAPALKAQTEARSRVQDKRADILSAWVSEASVGALFCAAPSTSASRSRLLLTMGQVSSCCGRGVAALWIAAHLGQGVFCPKGRGGGGRSPSPALPVAPLSLRLRAPPVGAPPWSALRGDSLVPAPSQNSAPCLSLGASYLRDQAGRILSARAAGQSQFGFEAAKPFGADAVLSAEDMWACVSPALFPENFPRVLQRGGVHPSHEAHQPCCFMEGPGCSALCTQSHGAQPLAFPCGCLRAAAPVLRLACAAWPCPPLPARVSGALDPGGPTSSPCAGARLTLAHALEKCLTKGKGRREQALAAAILGLVCVQLGPGAKGEELSHSLQPPLVSVLQTSTAGPAAWLHCASALGVGCYDGAAAGVQDLVFCLTCLEGVFSRPGQCASPSAPHAHEHVLSRRLLRLPGSCPVKTIALPLELAGPKRSLFTQGIYTAFKDVPGSGLHHHLPKRASYSVISLAWVLCWCWMPALKACKIPPFKKHRPVWQDKRADIL
ncbi:Interferon-related developmental regulator 2 [Camelus dromedarius]|uniref:Interferon-related developmental regulator 2 n=1 Tax=Camelus dromedarius TaxID=9838 RepID=A0A5N4ECW8_CAMDR|nr:Interferon-related developmental regulator 2 [Camelus dromedarius]